MVETAELTQERTLTLPPEIAARFHASDRFIVWVDGDTLYLKRMTPASITETVAQSPTGEPLSVDDIDTIVHEVRRQRHSR